MSSSAILGLAALDLLFVGAGASALGIFGLRLRPALPYLGLCFFTGWALLVLLSSIALMAGLSLEIWQIAAMALAIVVTAALVHRRGPPRVTPIKRTAKGTVAGRVVATASASLLGVYTSLMLVRAALAPADANYDVWAFWLPKAATIFHFGGLETGLGGFATFDNPEYPPGIPALVAVSFRFASVADPTLVPLQAALVSASFLLAAAALLASRVAGSLYWPVLLALAVSPNLTRYFESGLADLPVAYLLALSALSLGLWLLDDRRELLALAGLFLTAAALVKSEGFALAIVLVVSTALGATIARRTLRPLVPLLMAPVLALAAWKVWLATHGVPTGSVLYSPADLLEPSYLAGRLDRLSYGSREYAEIIVDPRRWLTLFGLAVVLALLALALRRPLGTMYATWLIGAFATLVLPYWISSVDVVWYVDTSAERTSASLVVVAATLLPLIATDVSTTAVSRRRAAKRPRAAS